MTRAAALLALLAGAARAAVETHEVHASGSFGLLRRKHVNPERRLQTDYAPSAAPSEAPTFETWMPTAVGGKLGWCETYNSQRWTGGSCDDSGDPCSSNDGVRTLQCSLIQPVGMTVTSRPSSAASRRRTAWAP